MKALLDTHILLWSLLDPKKLSKITRNFLENPENKIFLSTVTFWEISLKYALGKLKLSGLKPSELPHLAKKLDFQILSLTEEESSSFFELKRLHGDPFDRMLVWQAIQRQLPLLSVDKQLRAYEKFGLKMLG